MVKWRDNDKLFFEELQRGFCWQGMPALFFKLHSLNVQMPDLRVRSSINEADKWLNETDLIVNNYHIEVKSRNEKFTTPQSFPYSTIFVDTVSGYEAKKDKPIAYIMVSRPTGVMLCLRADSSKGWLKEKKFDHVRKIYDEFYMAPKNMLQTLDVLVEFIR